MVVILGASGLRAVIVVFWEHSSFADPGREHEVTWKRDQCCLFEHHSLVCFPHPGEMNSCHSVFGSTKELR